MPVLMLAGIHIRECHMNPIRTAMKYLASSYRIGGAWDEKGRGDRYVALER
jgi:hypothetical protein